jgi:hypothetical protein
MYVGEFGILQILFSSIRATSQLWLHSATFDNERSKYKTYLEIVHILIVSQTIYK